MSTNVDITNAEDEDTEETVFPVGRDAPTPTVTLLKEFRERWQQELSIEPRRAHGDRYAIDDGPTQQSDEDKARALFMQASELEKLGKVFEAMHLYRRAVQIVPDIEFKMYEAPTVTPDESVGKDTVRTEEDVLNANDGRSDDDADDVEADDDDEEDDTNLDDVDLMLRFQLAVQRTGLLFQRSGDRSVIHTGGLHMSDLPMEIMLYILKWVVSADLDMRSLEQCSAVCKGFYICAKDHDIWRLVCMRIWGVQVGALKGSSYLSWRHMYLNRHRVHFNGCYISKTSYLRYGENSFQDQFYRPIHLIEYYRYVRFFPDGSVVMMTTPDDPAQTVGKLRRNVMRSDLMKGHYRLHGDIVIIVLKRKRTAASAAASLKHSRRVDIDMSSSANHNFYIELSIVSSTKRKFNQLKWKNYSIIQMKNKAEVSTDFELTAAMYPPFTFSRVKSYHSVSEHPLE